MLKSSKKACLNTSKSLSLHCISQRKARHFNPLQALTRID